MPRSTPPGGALSLCLLLAACGTSPLASAGSDLDPGQGAGPAAGGTGSAASDPKVSPAPPQATIVLIHGMGGFRKVAGLDYFFGVPAAWRAAGARVFVPGTTMLASVEKRAGELQRQLDAVPGPLILVGHSQGGLDARFLLSRLGYGGRVRALVTLATPHRGSPVADLLLGAAGSGAVAAADVLLGELGWSLDGAREVTVQYMNGTFNPTVPDLPGVTYWSYSGRAAPLAQGRGNGWLHGALLPTWGLLEALHQPSDGVVPEASAHWGEFQGAIPADHLGEVGQPLGATPVFDHRAFYRALLQRFHDQGW